VALEQLHRLPDDGNKYELVRGELFVTPAPSPTLVVEIESASTHRRDQGRNAASIVTPASPTTGS
jgi:hypothetical protein